MVLGSYLMWDWLSWGLCRALACHLSRVMLGFRGSLEAVKLVVQPHVVGDPGAED